MDDDTLLKDLIPNDPCTDVDSIFGNQTHIDLVDCLQSLGINAVSTTRFVQQRHQIHHGHLWDFMALVACAEPRSKDEASTLKDSERLT